MRKGPRNGDGSSGKCCNPSKSTGGDYSLSNFNDLSFAECFSGKFKGERAQVANVSQDWSRSYA